jgi:hypothetical protein
MASEGTSQTELTLGTPKRGAKEGYLMLFFSSRASLGNIIAQMEDATDPRLLMFTKFLISSITDDDIRDDVWKKLDANIKEIDRGDGTNEEKAKKRNDVCMEILGDVTAFYDEFMGISHTIRIGVS